MTFEEYQRPDPLGSAELVARGEVSVGELLDAALARQAEVNAAITGSRTWPDKEPRR